MIVESFMRNRSFEYLLETVATTAIKTSGKCGEKHLKAKGRIDGAGWSKCARVGGLLSFILTEPRNCAFSEDFLPLAKRNYDEIYPPLHQLLETTTPVSIRRNVFGIRYLYIHEDVFEWSLKYNAIAQNRVLLCNAMACHNSRI